MFGLVLDERIEFLVIVLATVIAVCLLMLTCAVAYFCLLRRRGQLSENPWDRRKATLKKYKALQANPPRPSGVYLANGYVFKWPWRRNGSNGRNYVDLEGGCFTNQQPVGHCFLHPPVSPTPSDEVYKTPLDEGNCRCVIAQPSPSRQSLPMAYAKAQQLSRAPLAQWSTKPPTVEHADIVVDSGTPASSSTAKATKERKQRKKHRDGSDTTDSETKHDRHGKKKRRLKPYNDSEQ